MFEPGVCGAYIDVVPAPKGDRRVKKYKLAVFRLQQYNQILQVCLCPTVICLLLLLNLTLTETEAKCRKRQTCSQIICNDSPSGAGSVSTSRPTSKNCFLACTRSPTFNSKKHWKKRIVPYVHRAMIGIQLLLLKAGDIELNPGPKSMFKPCREVTGDGIGHSYVSVCNIEKLGRAWGRS